MLYERLIFERGLFDASITPNGSHQTWTPGDGVSDEELRSARTLHEEGGPFQIAVGVQPAKDIPADPKDMRVVLAGEISRHYVAEWESVLRELAPFEPDWVDVFALPSHAIPGDMRREIGRLDFGYLGDREFMPDAEPFLRSFTYKAFNHDSVIARDAGAAFNITPQFAPVLERQGIELMDGGDTALEIWAPGLGGLGWETVLEFRGHPGAGEARAMLREFERMARESESGDLGEFKQRIQSEITDALTGVIQGMRPSLGSETARQTLHTGVSMFVPVVGPASAMAETALQQRRFDRSWHSALMLLRPKG